MENEKIIAQSIIGCRVTPYVKRQSPLLEMRTGTYDKVYHKYVEYAGFVCPYNEVASYLTYSRPINELKKVLPDYEITNIPVTPYRRTNTQYEIVGVDSLRPAQSELVGKIMGTKRKNNAWFINLQTAEGKTLLSIYLSVVFGYKTWVLCYLDGILDQWISEYLKYTNIPKEKILRVDGTVLKKLSSGKLNPNDYEVFLSTPSFLTRFANRMENFLLIEDIFTMCGIGTIIYDEAHRDLSNTVKINSVSNIKYQLYLSADYGQGNDIREEIFNKVFRYVPVLSPNDELKKSMKYTKLVVAEYNTHPDMIEGMEPFDKYGFNSEYYMRYEFKKGAIVGAIRDLLSIFVPNDDFRTLILFTNIEFVDKMYDILCGIYPGIVGKYHGEVGASDKAFAKDDAKIIVATYNSFGTGINTQDIKYVISTNQCNKVVDNQAAGRARPLRDGSDAWYVMLVDSGFSYNTKKLKKRLGYLTETKSRDTTVYRVVLGGEK